MEYKYKFQLSWSVVLEKKIFKDFSYIIICKTLIPYCGPIVPPGSWFEQTWISTISGSFHINLSFPGPVVLEKIFKWHHPILAFSWLSPLWTGAWSFIWTNLKPLHSRMMCTKFGWIWPRGSWEEVENVKLTDIQTDDGQKAITIAHLSLPLRWAKKKKR